MAFWNRQQKIEPEMTRGQIKAFAEALTMAAARVDNYRFSGGSTFAPFTVYEQGSYQSLYELYTGNLTSGFQLGALFAQPIVKYFTAFTIGRLPHVVVRERAKLGGGTNNGAKIAELTQFANQFIRDQHVRLARLAATSSLYGDAYGLFGFDRNIEVVAPYPDVVSPGFTLFSGRLASFNHQIKKLIQFAGPGEEAGTKYEVSIERYYTDEQLIVQATSEEASGELKKVTKTPVLKAPNTLGKCPVVHLPNNFIPGGTFGWSEFHPSIPFMRVYHDVVAAGFTAQQYHGKPILQVTGITSNVKTWLTKSFGIDLGTGEDELAAAMRQFFEKHKFLAFTDGAKGEFIESKYPTGATKEIAELAFQGIVRVSTIPEFLFGVAIDSANASIREQYVGLKNRVHDKQVELGEVIKQLIKWAFYYYSTVTNDPETGLPMDTYGFITNPEELEQFQIDIIWPPILNSDEQVKTEALALLQSMNALSFQTAYEAWPEYVPDPEEELNRIRQEFKDDTLPPKAKSGAPLGDGGNPLDKTTNTKSQRTRDDRGSAGDNSGKSAAGGKR